MLGDTISFVDVTIASWIKRSFGAQSQEWKDIEEWTAYVPNTTRLVCDSSLGVIYVLSPTS